MTDTIDRDELLRELTKRRAEKEHDRNLGSGFYKQGYIGGFYKQGYMDGYDDAIKAIDSILPADVEPVRKGTWRMIDLSDDYKIVKCSKCDYLMEQGTQTPYCPRCGVKMEDKNA